MYRHGQSGGLVFREIFADFSRIPTNFRIDTSRLSETTAKFKHLNFGSAVLTKKEEKQAFYEHYDFENLIF